MTCDGGSGKAGTAAAAGERQRPQLYDRRGGPGEVRDSVAVGVVHIRHVGVFVLVPFVSVQV